MVLEEHARWLGLAERTMSSGCLNIFCLALVVIAGCVEDGGQKSIHAQKSTDAVGSDLQLPPPLNRAPLPAGIVTKIGPGNYLVLRSKVLEFLAIPRELAGEVRGEAEYNGVRVYAFNSDSIYGALGFLPGDIVEKIGDTPLGRTSLESKEQRELAQWLRAQSHIVVTLRRDGQRISHLYNIQ